MNSAFKRPFTFPTGRNTRTRPFTPSRGLQISCCISDIRRLGPKPLEPVLNEEVNTLSTHLPKPFPLTQGKIHSNTDATTKASVFAIFDQNKKLQYIGFSKGLESSLRTLFTRRPDKAHYYKSVNLTKLDQKEMMGIRDAWFHEVGGPPAGNKCKNCIFRMFDFDCFVISGFGETSLATTCGYHNKHLNFFQNQSR